MYQALIVHMFECFMFNMELSLGFLIWNLLYKILQWTIRVYKLCVFFIFGHYICFFLIWTQHMNDPCTSYGYAKCKDEKFVIVLSENF